MPAYGSQRTIAHLRIWFEIRVLWLRVTVNLLNRNYTSPPNTLPYETLAGGYTNLYDQRDLLDNSNFDIGILQAADITHIYNGNLCFVPTYSALDVPTITLATASARYINNVTNNPSLPRIPTYIAQENGTGTQANQPHIRFTARNSEWLYNEMQRPFNGSGYTNKVGCSTECTPLTISSSLAPGQRLCANTSATFSIPGLAAGTPVTWTATPANNFTVATGSGPTFSTSVSNIAVGNSTITALVGECQTPVATTVPTGPGEHKGYYTGGATGGGTLSTYQSIGPTGVNGADIGLFLNDPYNFTFTSDLPGLYLTSTSGTSTHFTLKSGQGVTITATATNAPCGLVGRFTFISPTSGFRYSATPNPTTDDLLVTTTEEKAPTALPFEANLYDNQGKQVKTKKSTANKALLDMRDLPAGLYNLRVGQGKEAYSEHIQVTH